MTDCRHLKSVLSKRESMSIKRLQPAATRLAHPAIVRVLVALVILCGDSSLLGDNSPQSNPESSSLGHNVVVLLDRNPHQKKVLALEIALAEGIIEKLDQPENVFTVITF